MEHVRRNLKFRDISANRILLFLLPVSFQWCDRLNETNRECFVRSKSNRLIHHSTIYYGRYTFTHNLWKSVDVRNRNPRKNSKYIDHRSKDVTILLSQLCSNAWKAKWWRTSIHVSRKGIHSIEYIYVYTWTLADVHCAWVKCEQINSWMPWWRKFRVTESSDKATRKQRLSKIRRQTTYIYVYIYTYICHIWQYATTRVGYE